MKQAFKFGGRTDSIIFQARIWHNAYHNSNKELLEVRDGDILVHFAGFYGNRIEAMQEWFHRVNTDDALAVPWEETRVKKEVEDFWERVSVAKATLNRYDAFNLVLAAREWHKNMHWKLMLIPYKG